MRSRYAAYASGAVDYVVATHDPKTRGQVNRDAVSAWSKESEWLGLEILAHERGGESDDDGVVEFVARGKNRGSGQAFVHHERSRFRKHEGAWVYVDGTLARGEPVRAVKTPGRNDPCSCGSGLKWKRCCGR